MDNDNIIAFINNMANTLMQGVAERVWQRRLELNWTQKLLALKAGIPLATYCRFKSLREISLRGLGMIVISLGAEDECNQ